MLAFFYEEYRARIGETKIEFEYYDPYSNEAIVVTIASAIKDWQRTNNRRLRLISID